MTEPIAIAKDSSIKARIRKLNDNKKHRMDDLLEDYSLEELLCNQKIIDKEHITEQEHKKLLNIVELYETFKIQCKNLENAVEKSYEEAYRMIAERR